MPSKSTQLARHLGRRIATLRDARGLTQERLAWDLESNKGYLSRVERGERLPSIDFLVAVARRLGVEVRDLFLAPERSPQDEAMELVRKRGPRFAAQVIESARKSP